MYPSTDMDMYSRSGVLPILNPLPMLVGGDDASVEFGRLGAEPLSPLCRSRGTGFDNRVRDSVQQTAGHFGRIDTSGGQAPIEKLQTQPGSRPTARTAASGACSPNIASLIRGVSALCAGVDLGRRGCRTRASDRAAPSSAVGRCFRSPRGSRLHQAYYRVALA